MTWQRFCGDLLTVPGLDAMSREELLALILAQAKTIDALTARLDALEVENVELKRRLAQNSRNSSKPPSSDAGERTPPPRSLRRKTGRKPGKQPGARGFSLKLIEDPDEVLDYIPDCCRGCGTDLHDAASVGVVRRQVTDSTRCVVRTSRGSWTRRRRPIPLSAGLSRLWMRCSG